MHRIAVMIVMVAVICLAVVPAVAQESSDVKTLKEQVKSLQSSNVVMKEDLAKTQLQVRELQVMGQTQAEAAKKDSADLSKQISELRQGLADEKAAHEAQLQKEQEARAAAEAEAARQRKRAKDRQLWLYIAGAVGLAVALRD